MDGPARTVTVLGGTGFIGTHLIRLLLEAGHQVTVASRRSAGAGAPADNCRYVCADVADPASVSAAVEGASVVFHLATGGGERWSDFERDFVLGTENVARACQQHNVERLVYASSLAALYLGQAAVVDERTGVDPTPNARNYYSRAKIAAERLLERLHAQENLPVVIMRPGIVMGPGGPLEHLGVGTWPSDTCCIGWGSGRTPLPFVLVQDVARALQLAIDTPGIEGMAFNLVGEVRLSAVEFVRLLAKHSGRNYRFYPQSLPARQVVELTKWALKLTARRPENPFPTFRELRSSALRAHLDCAAAHRLLGWRPCSSLDDFVREAIRSNLRPIPPGDLRLSSAEHLR